MTAIETSLRSVGERDSRLGYLQIADAIEDLIKTGTLQGEDRLPSTQELIEILGVSRLTVQRSLNRLSERGLVRRIPKRGTFVTSGVACSTFGLLSCSDPLTIPSPFYRLLISAFHRLSSTYLVNFNNYIFMEAGDTPRNLMNLEEDIKAGKLKGLIIISSTLEMDRWLESHCTIPWVSTCKPAIQKQVYLGIQHLCRCGYRKIRVLSLFEAAERFEEGRQQERLGMLQAYTDCGCPGREPELVACGQAEVDGYNYVKSAFADGGDVPDALLVNHDVLTKGVLMAALELGLKIPDDLGLVTHMNKGADILSPVELDALLVDPDEIAKRTLEYITLNSGRLMGGKNSCPYRIESQLVNGCSTQEGDER